MFNKLTILLLLFVFVGCAQAQSCQIEPYFSPYDDIEKVVHQELSLANRSVSCSLFGITNPKLVNDLVDLSKKGVEVRLGLDKIQAGIMPEYQKRLKANGVKIVIKKTGVLEHNKFCVIDGDTVIMGSWNWSSSAQSQDNSDVIIRYCPAISSSFDHAFERIYKRDAVKK